MLPNQLSVEYLGCATDLSQTILNDSASRQTMMSGHVSQMLVFAGATPRRFKAGTEPEYAKTTFNIPMPVDARVVKVIHKYPNGIGAGSFKFNPETIVIYEDLEAKLRGVYRLGMVSIVGYHCKHQAFGFKYRMKEAIKRLAPGEFIPKDTVFAESPNVMPNGDYAYGIEANVAFMSVPQIIEDGFVVSESFAKRLTTTAISSRMAGWGSDYYPLNLYGDEHNYKPFPDIGDRIRPDGLLFALREYDPLLAVCDMTPKALMDYDDVYDKLTFGKPGALVTDVVVWRDLMPNRKPHKKTPVGMDAQTLRYAKATSTFFATILKTWKDYQQQHRNQHVECTEPLHRLLVDCQSDDPSITKQAVSRTYRTNPLDDWTVEIKFVRDVVPTVGFKITDLHGGKGVNNNTLIH